MDAIFVDGKPAKITIHDFRRHHLYSFPKLADAEYDELISAAIDRVYSMFPGIQEMWDLHRNKQVWFDKTTLCYGLITAWLIAEQYPELTAVSTADIMLKRKKVDGTDITYNVDMFNGKDVMVMLRSNSFGRQALMMMQTAPRRALLRLERFA